MDSPADEISQGSPRYARRFAHNPPMAAPRWGEYEAGGWRGWGVYADVGLRA
jgi:hypothetical protein